MLVRVYEGTSGNGASPISGVLPPLRRPLTEDSFQDANLNLTLTEYRDNGTTVYIADILHSSRPCSKLALHRAHATAT